MKAKERLYLDADRKKICKEEDPEARFLLVAKGQEIPKAIAEEYGLSEEKPKKKAAPKAENKKAKPPENKGTGSGLKINKLKDQEK